MIRGWIQFRASLKLIADAGTNIFDHYRIMRNTHYVVRCRYMYIYIYTLNIEKQIQIYVYMYMYTILNVGYACVHHYVFHMYNYVDA